MTFGGESSLRAAIDGDLDPILPEQLQARGRRTLQPEQRLMAAVLKDALNLRRRGPRAAGRSARLRYAEVRRWFASNDLQWPCSFVNVCQALGFEPSAVRASAQALDADSTERCAIAVSQPPARAEPWVLAAANE
jgi:hypothetical protein